MRTPAGADGLEFVWIVQMLPPRLTFQVQETETLSPSGSLVVVEAVRLSFVFGEAGLKLALVAAGRGPTHACCPSTSRPCSCWSPRPGAPPAGIDATTFPRVASR